MKRFEKVLGTILAILFVSFILFSLGYTIINEGILNIGSQSRYFDYQSY